MFSKIVVLICLSFCVNFSLGKIFNDENVDQSNEKIEQKIIIQFENKMKRLFSIWKTETNRKLDTLEQRILDLEENVNINLNISNTNIINKLEENIDGKIKLFENSISEKLIQNVNSDMMDKKTFVTFENNINLKFDDLARNVTKKLEENINCSPEILKKVIDFEEMLNQKLEVLDKKINGKVEENLSTRFDDLAKNTSNKFEENINCTLDIKKSTDFEEKEVPQSYENELPDKVMNVSHMLNATATPKSIPQETEMPCKEESLSSNHPWATLHLMDNDTLDYITVKRDSAGLLTYFEMQVAIKAGSGYVQICLFENVARSENLYYLSIGWDSNKYTELETPGTIFQHVETRNILSSSEFRTFYITIDNGTLQFGKEGGSSPLISHYNDGYRSLDTFQFIYYGSRTAKFRFDCPAPALGQS